MSSSSSPSVSSQFGQPLLIYDDKCYSCTRFAQIASTLSGGWIRIAGHYYSDEARRAKNLIFPPGYDSTGMFWLVNRAGAYGARAGLPRVAKEILYGAIAGRQGNSRRLEGIGSSACEYKEGKMSCYTPTSVLQRIARLLSHGAAFRFSKN